MNLPKLIYQSCRDQGLVEKDWNLLTEFERLPWEAAAEGFSDSWAGEKVGEAIDLLTEEISDAEMEAERLYESCREAKYSLETLKDKLLGK